MANDTSVCKDTPLVIASSATGFLTTVVAVAVAWYAFLILYDTAPQAYLDFVDDLETFYGQSDSLLEEFGEMKAEVLQYIFDNNDFHNFESLMTSFGLKTKDIKRDADEIKNEVRDPTAKAGSRGPTSKEDMKEIKAAGPVQKGCPDPENPPPGPKLSVRTGTSEAREARASIKAHFQSSFCARIWLGVLWWWEVRNTVSSIRADIASQRTELSFL
jgi:hypothetical protein